MQYGKKSDTESNDGIALKRGPIYSKSDSTGGEGLVDAGGRGPVAFRTNLKHKFASFQYPTRYGLQSRVCSFS